MKIVRNPFIVLESFQDPIKSRTLIACDLSEKKLSPSVEAFRWEDYKYSIFVISALVCSIFLKCAILLLRLKVLSILFLALFGNFLKNMYFFTETYSLWNLSKTLSKKKLPVTLGTKMEHIFNLFSFWLGSSIRRGDGDFLPDIHKYVQHLMVVMRNPLQL